MHCGEFFAIAPVLTGHLLKLFAAGRLVFGRFTSHNGKKLPKRFLPAQYAEYRIR